MRWQIAETKRKIYTANFEGHHEDIEMSGEKISSVIGYQVKKGFLSIEREFIFPMFRLQPNNTLASYRVKDNDSCIIFGQEEVFDRVEIDGTLIIFTHVENLIIKHQFYPSTTLPVFYELIEIINQSDKEVAITYDQYKKVDVKLGCEGYLYTERIADNSVKTIEPKATLKICFNYQARFANQERLAEKNSLGKRMNRVNELFNQCDLTSESNVLDTMFAFAKLRVGESIYKTRKGRVHSPGGINYYAGIWCNDQSEYSTPWFAFTNDQIEQEAACNAMLWYDAYMNEDYLPIPSSLISEGHDYWNGVGDRGDAAMFLYGNTRYYLTIGQTPDKKGLRMLQWCCDYIFLKMNDDGIVASDTDELENRISSGDANLNTNSLAYGGLKNYALLLARMGDDLASANLLKKADLLAEAIKKYFGKTIHGYDTYQYHHGCEEIRAWTCLPLYMGIDFHVAGTLQAIEDKLWTNGSCRSTEGENILWDRSCLYYIATLFRCGYVEKGWEKLDEYAKTRLLGERVPYAIEAYPEFNMRHLSAESGLFCRIITDGILDIQFAKDGFTIQPRLLPKMKKMKVEKLFCNGKYYTIDIFDGIVKVIEKQKIITGTLGKKILIR